MELLFIDPERRPGGPSEVLSRLRAVASGFDVGSTAVIAARSNMADALEVREVIDQLVDPLWASICRGPGFERDAPLDSENRIADVDAQTDAVGAALFTKRGNQIRACHWGPVKHDRKAFLELEHDVLALGRGGVTQYLLVDLVGNLRPWIVGFTTADGRAPQPGVD